MIPPDRYSAGHIVSDAEELLGLCGADFGVLVVGDGAKVLGPDTHGQEILVISEYFRRKPYEYVTKFIP